MRGEEIGAGNATTRARTTATRARAATARILQPLGKPPIFPFFFQFNFLFEVEIKFLFKIQLQILF